MAIGLIANAWFIWTTDARLAAQWAAIRAAGEPVTLADLAHPPIPPEKNAATYLRQADADVRAIDNAITVPDLYKLFNSDNVFYPIYPLPPQVQKAIKAACDAHPKAFGLLEQAAACPDYDLRLDYTLSSGEFISELLPVVQSLRSNVRVLQYRIWLLVAEKKHDEAMRTALVIFRLGQHCARNPAFVSYLVAITFQDIAISSADFILQTGPVSKEVRDALDAELAIQERMDGFSAALKSERPFIRDFLAQHPGRHFWLINRGLWNRRESEYLDKKQSLLVLLRERASYEKIEKSFDKADSQWGNDPNKYAEESEHNLFKGIFSALKCVVQTQAKIRCLRVLNSLQTHVPAGSETIPKLSELGLPAETTVDPFNGQPLIVKKLPNGWLVYSVGWNLQDDGGKITGADHYLDAGVGPPPAAKSSEKRP